MESMWRSSSGAYQNESERRQQDHEKESQRREKEMAAELVKAHAKALEAHALAARMAQRTLALAATRAHELSLAQLAGPAPALSNAPDFMQWLSEILKFEDESGIETLQNEGIAEVETLLAMSDSFLEVCSYHFSY